MKKGLIFLTILAIVLSLLPSGCFDDNDSPIAKFIILTTADLQSQILPFEIEIEGEEKEVGGFEKIKTIYQNYKDRYGSVLLVSTGDDLFGPFYKIFEGRPEIEGMNLCGYSVVTCGNHEFDNGIDFYLNALKGAEFQIVSSNLSIADDTTYNPIKPYVIEELSGIKIGFFGLITPDLKKVSNVGEGVEINSDIESVARQMIDELKEKGATVIIALTHMGKKLDRELAQKVSGIDFIIGGHDHLYVHEIVKNPSGKDTVIVQAGSKGVKIGVLEITIKDGTVIDHKWQTILLDENVQGDLYVHQRMQYYMDEYDKETEKVIGESKVDLDARESFIRRQETNLGNLVADSWTSWIEGTIALVNSGSIRGDKIYPSGEITYKSALEILPFMNEIYEVELTGEQLKQILEISASSIIVSKDGCDPQNRASSGGFLQVSNIKFDIDLNEEPFCATYNDDRTIDYIINKGERVKNISIVIDGDSKPLDPEKRYTILVNGWTVSGGDGYYLFLEPGISKKNTTNVAVDLLIEYIKKFSPISPSIEGRIGIIDEK